MWSERRPGSDIVHRAHGWSWSYLCYKPCGWLMGADRSAEGSRGLLRSAVVLLQWMGLLVCTGVLAAALLGVLVFAVGTAGSGTAAGATDAVGITAGCEYAGGAPGHSGVAGAMLPGEELSCVGFCLFTASGCLSRMWSRARRYCSSTNNLD